MTDEKVCVTAEQLKNISKSYAKYFPVRLWDKTCPKSDKWVLGFFGKGKKKKELKDPIESWVNRKITSKIEGWADGFF